MSISFLQNISCLDINKPRLHEMIHSPAQHVATKQPNTAYELELQFACGWSLLAFNLVPQEIMVGDLDACRLGARLLQLAAEDDLVLLRTTFGTTVYRLTPVKTTVPDVFLAGQNFFSVRPTVELSLYVEKLAQSPPPPLKLPAGNTLEFWQDA